MKAVQTPAAVPINRDAVSPTEMASASWTRGLRNSFRTLPSVCIEVSEKVSEWTPEHLAKAGDDSGPLKPV